MKILLFFVIWYRFELHNMFFNQMPKFTIKIFIIGNGFVMSLINHEFMLASSKINKALLKT